MTLQDVKQAVLSLLDEEGKPLTAEVIASRLAASTSAEKLNQALRRLIECNKVSRSTDDGKPVFSVVPA
ncbi:MAG: hypothetical protein ACPGMR_03350 [Pontibacterium sp.]